MGAQSEIGLILRRNGFQVIINDDFLEEGEGGVMPITPILRIAYRFISNVRQGIDTFGSVVEHLIYNPAARVQIPPK